MGTTISYGDDLGGNFKVVTGATTLKTTDSGKDIFLKASTGAVVTLPPLADGLNFVFTITSAFATSNWVVKSAEGDNISGFIADIGATPAVVIAGAEDQINFVATAETIGDHVSFIADTTNSQWIVKGACAANGGITATDPS